MLVYAVIVGLVPYYDMDPDTPISSAFSSHGLEWATYIITLGACTALCSTLMGSLFPQPRILMAMARDGLLPSFFSDVNKRTQVPIKNTIATGCLSGLLAFFIDVDQLAGMVSVGTLLAFTIEAISVLILRYVPPDVVPLPSSLQGAIDIITSRYSSDGSSTPSKSHSAASGRMSPSSDSKGPVYDGLFKKASSFVASEEKRRKIAGWTIMVTCMGILVLTGAASCLQLQRFHTNANCSNECRQRCNKTSMVFLNRLVEHGSIDLEW